MGEILVRALGFISIIALGYFLKVKGIVKREDAKVLSTIVMNVTLPAALLTSASALTLNSGILIPLLLGFVMNLIMDWVGYWEARDRDLVAKSAGMVQISGYNIGTFTLPFVQAFFPAAYLVPVILFDTSNALMVLGGNFTLAANLNRKQEAMSLGDILRNLFGSIPFAVYLVTFLLAALGLQVPQPILSITNIAANANPFLAMLMLGIMIDLRLQKQDIVDLFRLLGLRLLVSFLAALPFYYLLPVPLVVRQMLIICVFSPISVVAPVYAMRLGSTSSQAANLNSLCILSNLLIMTLLVLIFSL